MKLPSSITLCEVGLRDGLQNEQKILSTQEKLALLMGLIDAGFSVIEAGSFMNPKTVPQMADTDALFAAAGTVSGVRLRALAANLRGIERAAACGCRNIKLNISASRQHNLRNLNMTLEQCMSGFSACAEAAVKHGIHLSGSISMPFASPWEGKIPKSDVEAVIEAYLKAGITELSLSDASGMAAPCQVFDLCRHVRKKYPNVSWWLHFHNTRGLAMANLLAAMEAGMNRFDSSIGGLGGCPFVPGAAGNLSTEDVLNLCEESQISTGIDLTKVLKLSANLSNHYAGHMDSYLLRSGRPKDAAP